MIVAAINVFPNPLGRLIIEFWAFACLTHSSWYGRSVRAIVRDVGVRALDLAPNGVVSGKQMEILIRDDV